METALLIQQAIADKAKVEHCAGEAEAWAIAHGLVMRVLVPGLTKAADGKPITDVVYHAPVTVLPMPFPTHVYNDAAHVATDFNKLMDRIARDHKFLEDALKDCEHADEFTKKQLDILRMVLKNGVRQQWCLAINRSDYMLHQTADGGLDALQVEINTIACSFAGLSQVVGEMHR